MADRLLSDEEMRTIGLCIISQSRDGYVTGEGVSQMQIDTAKAQDTKTAKAVDEGWVKWGSSMCTEHEPITIGGFGHYKRLCTRCWQERKRSIGL